jgi:hypothetical protein
VSGQEVDGGLKIGSQSHCLLKRSLEALHAMLMGDGRFQKFVGGRFTLFGVLFTSRFAELKSNVRKAVKIWCFFQAMGIEHPWLRDTETEADKQTNNNKYARLFRG